MKFADQMLLARIELETLIRKFESAREEASHESYMGYSSGDIYALPSAPGQAPKLMFKDSAQIERLQLVQGQVDELAKKIAETFEWKKDAVLKMSYDDLMRHVSEITSVGENESSKRLCRQLVK